MGKIIKGNRLEEHGFGLIWLRRGAISGLYERGNETLGTSHKVWGIS
jgi:hypothetical protein